MYNLESFQANDIAWKTIRRAPDKWGEAIQWFIENNKPLFNRIVNSVNWQQYVGVEADDVHQMAIEEYIVQLKSSLDSGEKDYPHLSVSVSNAVKRRLSTENSVCSGSFSTKIRKCKKGTIESVVSIDGLEAPDMENAKKILHNNLRVQSFTEDQELIHLDLCKDLHLLLESKLTKDDKNFILDCFSGKSIMQLAEEYNITQRRVRYKKKTILDRLRIPAKQAELEAYL